MADSDKMKDTYRSVCYHSLGPSTTGTITDSDRQQKLRQRIQENRLRTQNALKSSRDVFKKDSSKTDRVESRKDVCLSAGRSAEDEQKETEKPSGSGERSFTRISGSKQCHNEVSNEDFSEEKDDAKDEREMFICDSLTNGNDGTFIESGQRNMSSKVSKEQKERLRRRSSRSRERSKVGESVKPAPRVTRSVSEPGQSTEASMGVIRSLSQGSDGQDGSELTMELRSLQEELRRCTDFTERRKIRDKIRSLREKKQEVNILDMGRCSPPQCGRECDSEVTEKIRNLQSIQDIPELRKLLNETNDYDEKKQIRLALRQLRQRDKERENSRDAGQVDQRRRSLGSPSATVVRESGDTPNHRHGRRAFHNRISEDKVSESEARVTETSSGKDSRRQSVTLPIRGDNSPKNHKLSEHNKIKCKKKTSEEILVDHKPPIIPNRRDSTHNNQDSKHPSSTQNNEPAVSQNNVEESKVILSRSNSRSNSVVDTIVGNSSSAWLEKKKRSSSLPTSDRSQLSTLDMEAAFSELLSAVDDDVDPLSDTEQEKVQPKETVEEETSSGAMLKVNFDVQLVEPVQPTGSTISVIEGDDGSVTVQSVTQRDDGGRTVTEKTRLRRTESHSQEEERDTVIESKVTSPGGSDNYVKDVIKTRRKVTSRGSDYFTRTAYNIRKKTDFEGEEIEERDFTVESENFSASKGETWGDRAEAKVQVSRSKQLRDEEAKRHVLDTLKEREPSVDAKERAPSPHGKQLEVDPKHSVLNRMDISKASSGYGTGSDEEEKEEIVPIFCGKPAGCPEIKSMMRDVSTSEGRNVTLECTVSCSPSPSVTWFRGDKVVWDGASFDPMSGKATLALHNVRKDQMGEYKCVFSNTLGEAQTKAKLTVASVSDRAPRFLSSLVDMTVTEGHAVGLECQVVDATHVSWYKDGIIQRNSADFRQTFDGDKAKLEIGEIFLDDHGEYTCVAKNDKGETKTSCRIKVKESDGDGEVAPQFLSRPESNIYSFGDLILLECDVIGSPTPTLTWYRDGTKLSPNTRVKMLYDGRVALLKISQSATEDSGKYEVVAQNSCGKVSVDCLVVVKAKEGPPAILQALSDTAATCGKSLTLQCQIKGSPIPVILWRKDGRMIGNTSDFKQTYQNNIALLKIQEIMEQDGGCYECVARNSFGVVSSSCTITVEQGEKSEKGSSGYVSKKTDWLVGRGGTQPEELTQQRKSASVRRSESVRVTSTSNLALKPTFEPIGAKSQERPQTRNTTHTVQETSNKNLTQQQDVRSINTPDSAVTRDLKEKKSQSPSNIKITKVPSDEISSNNISEKSTLQPKSELQKSHTQVISPTDSLKDSQKKQASVKDDNTKKANDPPWKNISLRRTESARVTNNYSREKPLTWKREETEKTERTVPTIVVENTDSNVDKPSGWRPVVMDTSVEKPKVNLRRCESARHENKSNIDIISKFLTNSQNKEKRDLNDNKIISVETPQKDTPVTKLKTESTGLNRSQSMRMLFENLEAKKNRTPAAAPVMALQRREQGLRRTSSLKVLPGEMESFRAEHNAKAEPSRFSNKQPDTSVTMASYDTIEDEEELHKLLSKSENFEERKKIRARMKEIREKKQKEWEAKRLQREAETDFVKKKFEQSEKEKVQRLKTFEKSAKEVSAERERILQKGEDLIKDKLKHADEDKKRHLETYDKLAKHEDKKVTVQKTPDGVIRTTIIKDSILTPVDSSQSNSAKPAGAQGAKAMFQKMDNAAPKPNNLAPGGGGGRALVRSPSAIKQMLLDWTKAMTQEYQNVEITNFSSSWNNGMAFCALIHHYYPEAFDFSTLDPNKRRHNFTLAFDTAEKYGDIAPLLDVDDMVRMQKPDWKCVFTYVQSLYRKLHTHERNRTMATVGE
ncbi:muscle M-line assembly protein unc-89-like isoform X4 [Saccostrea cucullata]|uniref:muscle M-line assembly protein unc-89-like isoform X4 n=1 Tax=Saccostrea cuccullata TaxID=36930 RepID=UPI002ED042E1